MSPSEIKCILIAIDWREEGAVPKPTEAELKDLCRAVTDYWRSQRDHHYALGRPLEDRQRATLRAFFSKDVLLRVRVLEGVQIQPPPEHLKEKVTSFAVPELIHVPSVTFIDAVVFRDKITNQLLFHSLVHVVQYDILGVERYFELFLRALIRKGAYINVPLEVQAYGLDSRFAAFPSHAFGVENEVKTWLREGRYET